MIGAQLPQADILVGRLLSIASNLSQGKMPLSKALEELRQVQSRFDPLSTAVCAPIPYIPPQSEYAAPGPEPVRASPTTPNVVIEVNW